MKIAVISYLFHPSPLFRPRQWQETLVALGHQVTYVHASFDHLSKTQAWKDIKHPGHVVIPVPAYKKNISWQRIRSHLVFVSQVKRYLKNEKWDLVVFCLPPNMLAKLASPQQTSWVDIIDLWPEALPFPRWPKMFLWPVLFVWSRLRNHWLADHQRITASADYFLDRCFIKTEQRLSLPLGIDDLQRAPTDLVFQQKKKTWDNELRVLVLGSLNNVADLDGLVEFVNGVSQQKSVVVEVLGQGEKKSFLLRQLKQRQIKYFDHGAVFDEKQKQPIFDRCHLGWNGFKDSTEIGVSYKSLEFLRSGIPLLNSLKGDLKQILKDTPAGWNKTNTWSTTAQEILKVTNQDYYQRTQQARQLFLAQFHRVHFQTNLDLALKTAVRSKQTP